METLANEVFNILKGANYQLRLFTAEGRKTTDPEQATRFFAYDEDLMVTLRLEDAKQEIVVQAGQGYDVPSNQRILSAIKKSAHKNLGEFTVRKFDKKIAPKDFAHQSVVEGFSKPFGSIKTSYIKMSEARLIIKHSKGVNEEVRGARSRNIHSLFIENSQGEKFKFPHRYMAGAKAMAMHVNEGGTPYDAKGEAILSICEDIAQLNKFVRHVRSNNLVNENNSEIVETVTNKLKAQKNAINSLSTLRGYNNFQVQENVEDTEKSVDISEKFLYNTFTTEELSSLLNKVGKIVAEKSERDSMVRETIKSLYSIIESDSDLGLVLNENDPEHPMNLINTDTSTMLSFLATQTTNEDIKVHLESLSGIVKEGVDDKTLALIEQMVNYLNLKGGEVSEKTSENRTSLEEDIIAEVRRKISQ